MSGLTGPVAAENSAHANAGETMRARHARPARMVRLVLTGSANGRGFDIVINEGDVFFKVVAEHADQLSGLGIIRIFV